MKNILVPTDFSPNAMKALEYAAQLAKIGKLRLTVIHVSVEMDIPFTENPIAAKHGLPLGEAVISEMMEISTHIRDSLGIEVETGLYGGSLVPGILEAIAECDADLVVMGTLGSAAISENLFGSVTADLIGKSPVPVLAIPLLSEWSGIRKILIAANHFDEKIEFAKPVFDIATWFNAAISVVVFTDERKAGAPEVLENNRGIHLLETRLKSEYEKSSIGASVLYGNDFEKAMANYISENEVDMLVMFTYKRNIFQSLFNPSKTRKMSYHADIPLLAIPVKE